MFKIKYLVFFVILFVVIFIFKFSHIITSHYRVENGKLLWIAKFNFGLTSIPKLIPNVNGNEITILRNKQYAKNSKNVFFRESLIKNADPNSFKIIEGYYTKDKASVFYKQNKLKKSSSKSFKILSNGYSTDGKTLYFYENTIHGIAPQGFVILKYGYSKNNNDAFFNGVPLNVDDVSKFKVISSNKVHTYAKDGSSYYFENKRIPVKDINSFEILKHGFAKDKYYIYQYESAITNRDVKSFYFQGRLPCDKNGPLFPKNCKLFKLPESVSTGWFNKIISFNRKNNSYMNVYYLGEYGEKLWVLTSINCSGYQEIMYLNKSMANEKTYEILSMNIDLHKIDFKLDSNWIKQIDISKFKKL